MRNVLWSVTVASLVWYALRLAYPTQVPTAPEVVMCLVNERGMAAAATAETGSEAALGLLAATGVAIVIGLAATLSANVAGPISTLAVWLKATPAIAFMPLLMAILGVGGIWDKVVLSAMISFFPMLIGIVDGVLRTPDRLRILGHCYAASRVTFVRRVAAMYALESLTSALKTAAPLAVVGAAVAGSLSPGYGGLGALIFQANARNAPEQTFAWIVCSGLLGVGFFHIADAVYAFARRRLRLEEL
jgi:NitT/TauT family transport system permease protein